ncbi:TetR/AcrR family transcriptional regulator [Streptomyces lancefieldiae]|uniref:TetR/AcrR family transcriptional regulator n=1 Tax=Streptomyces lancefieldiae TaxID=3075520 RepID=A0ABU3ASL4_9ACTN|nr:TetR/AcrR family transcriptional regulator [Streptomyces sp. DSM 40712]MDT0612587.1 TetR/AcrR family transcriptional regulator [Streptomyces sp. DSM 40712]
MDSEVARERALDAAERLFYGRGVQAVGMDDVRRTSGVSLKRLYQLFPAKEQLVVAYLDRRDARWRGELARYVDRHEGAGPRILAVFDWLGQWFAEPDFRGCAWLNVYGELGATSSRVAERVRAHKGAFRDFLDGLTADAQLPAAVGGQLFLLAEGAMVTAGVTGGTEPARQAREVARVLLGADGAGLPAPDAPAVSPPSATP